MTALMRASDVRGLPVVTITGGEDVAEIRDVVYHGERGDVLGFTLNKRGGLLRGRLREVLLAEDVGAIGRDAVMIEDEESCLVAPRDAPAAVARPEEDRNVLGNAVVTDAGVRLGTVTDLVLRVGGHGEVVGYEVRREGSKDTWFVPRPAQLAVSGTALMVPNDIERYARQDLSGFANALDDYGGTSAR